MARLIPVKKSAEVLYIPISYYRMKQGGTTNFYSSLFLQERVFCFSAALFFPTASQSRLQHFLL